MQDVNSLQLATEISRKEAQTELANIRRLISSDTETDPLTVRDSIERLKDKIQELGILSNQTLFLTEELSSRLDIQQDSLLQQETEQLATIEAMLAISRETADSLKIKGVFNRESIRRIAQCCLTMAREFKMSAHECRSLRYAAMLNDLGLVSSPKSFMKLTPATTAKEADNIKSCFSPVWRAVSGIPFLKTSLLFIRYIYNMYDDAGSLAVNDADIPLGAKILAVASTYERLYPGQSTRGKRDSGQLLLKIVNDSGGDIDPEILNTYMQIWRR